jgi:hypothetical protein
VRFCGTGIAILFVRGISSTFATPLERGALSVECKGIIARLLEATDESFDHYSPSGEEVFFRNRKSVLSCPGHRHPGISLTWDSIDIPPNEWFGLLAKVQIGSSYSFTQCFRSALGDKTKLADVEIPNAKIECQAFTLDGGGVNVSIRIDNALSVRPVLNER